MKAQYIVFSLITLMTLSKEAFASYNNNVSGFYLKHFAQSQDLKDASCRAFLKSVYRGGQPEFDGTDNWLKKIKSQNIKTVFDLRAETKNATLERDTLLKNGISYIKLPLSTSGTTQPAYFDVEVATPSQITGVKHSVSKSRMTSTEATIFVLNLMEEKVSAQNGEGIYLHCQRGEDRTGLMIALLRECNSTAWKSEFNSYGGVMYKPLQQLMNDVNKVRAK